MLFVRFYHRLIVQNQRFKNKYKKQAYIRVPINLDLDQDRYFIGADLGSTVCKGEQKDNSRRV